MAPKGYLIAPTNIGDTRWGSMEGGLPARSPKWVIMRCGKWGVTFDLCLSEGTVFGCSAEREVVCIDADSGAYRWQTPLPEEASLGIAVNEQRVFVSPYLLDSRSGQVLFDGRRLARYEFPLDFFNVGWIEGGFVTAVTGPENALVEVDSAGSTEEFINPFGFLRPVGGALFIGGEDCDIVAVRWGKAHPVWRLTRPASKDGRPMEQSGSPIVDGRLYLHLNFDTLWCIDVATGELIWKHGPDEIEHNETPYQCRPPSTILACDDRLYLCRTIEDDGFLQAHDAADGRLLWRVDAPQARALVIAGDLLFGSLHDLPVAWDRYSGEIVWRAAKPFAPLFHGIAAENKVLFTNTFGALQCYEWKKPYRSPARP